MPSLSVPASTPTVGDYLRAQGYQRAIAAAQAIGVPDKAISEWNAGNDGYAGARGRFCAFFKIDEGELFRMIDAGRIATRKVQTATPPATPKRTRRARSK